MMSSCLPVRAPLRGFDRRYEVKRKEVQYHESKEAVRSAVENTHYDPTQVFEKVKSHAVREGYSDSSSSSSVAEGCGVGGLDSLLDSLVPVPMAVVVKREEAAPIKNEPAAKRPKVKIAFE